MKEVLKQVKSREPSITSERLERNAVNGMSTMVVNPPTAAALVAVTKPSHEVRPGSFTCTTSSSRTADCRLALEVLMNQMAREPKKRRQYALSDIQNAVKMVAEDGVSIYAASKATGVPWSTIKDYHPEKTKR
ncbi:unnamed protein product [Leptidea sinapis]|uniref:HTH psq-type domain-containing protein n=1 Tax=Leptidea sinapis TaxID=189913 RepID=A0A5E4QP87_9NEOP|nr:unnamed protein product [Leptidea sinapis]